MSCPQCKHLWARIYDLEQSLKGAIYTTHEDASLLAAGLGLTYRQGQLIDVMYKANGRFMTTRVLGEALPGADDRKEDTSSNLVAVMLVKLRKVLGRPFFETKNGAGIRLSADAREHVERVLRGIG